MSVHHIPLSALNADHLTRLIDTPESKTCDYKRAVHPANLEDKWQDFLSDLASFANADGGDIIYGIAEGDGEQKGVATEIVGLSDFNKDDWVSRAEQRMKTRIHPNLTGVRFHSVQVDTKQVLVVRIPRSHMAPHAVKLDKGQHFCTRGEQGKVELDVSGIRSAFLASEGLADRLRRFRLDRVAKILPEVVPPQQADYSRTGTLLVHVLPVSAARPGFSLESASLFECQRRNNPGFLRDYTGWSPRYNFDGLSFRNQESGQRATLFRRGFWEYEDTQLAHRHNGGLIIPFQLLEKALLENLPIWLKTLESIGLNGPCLVSLSMLGVKGAVFGTARHYCPVNHQTAIDREVLLSDEVEVNSDSTAEGIATALKPMFDQLWNAVGSVSSPSYTEAGVCKLLRN